MTKMDSDALSIISDGLSAVTEGCRLPVRMKNSEDWPKAEVISMKQILMKETSILCVLDFIRIKAP